MENLIIENIKWCCDCKELKSYSMFYKNKKNKDGLFKRCIPCQLAFRKDYNEAYKKVWKKENKDKDRKHKLASYYRHVDSAIKWRKENRQRINGSHKTWRANNAEKIIAHKLANKYVTKKEYCEVCDEREKRLEMHHPDYGKPLDVITLCRKCHIRAHKLEEFE